MNPVRQSVGRRRSHERGYLIVLFVIIVAFVGIAAAMQVLVLTSVAATSRAYDSYRQGTTELARLEHAVTETLMDERQISIPTEPAPLADALGQNLTVLAATETVSVTSIPANVPVVNTYPGSGTPPDDLSAPPADLQPYLTPELAALSGPRVAVYPELTFLFASHRTVLDATRSYPIEVRARLIAVPLTRYPIAAYELPADIGSEAGTVTIGVASAQPAGIVPGRDAAFVRGLQAMSGVLPYHYRRRAALAAAYQYVFSQPFIDRVAEYAGITHFCDLGASTGTAVLAGMSKSGTTATWDLSAAGNGTYNTITLANDATVVFTEAGGYTLRLIDSAGQASTSPLFLLILGPANAALGPLNLEFTTVARPVVIVGYNVRVTAPAATALNGAVFLDPASAVAPSATITVGHFSYWAGSSAIPAGEVTATGVVPAAAEIMAPRVVYAATTAARL